MKPLQTYPVPGITVTFDPNACIHSAVCLKSLPAVFDIKRSPWIHADAETVEQIVATIDQCPSRALKYVLDGQAVSKDAQQGGQPVATIRITKNGPLLVDGSFALIDDTGATVGTMRTAALCRCGATRNAPFCDGSHVKIGFAPIKKERG